MDDWQHAAERLCVDLSVTIRQGKRLRERNLFDFNKFVNYAIRNNVEKLPDAFYDLSSRIADYWHYQLDDDTESDKKYSYIRLYQMVDTVNKFYAERDKQRKIILELRNYRDCANLVRILRKNPGITHRRLETLSNLSSSELNKQIERLEAGGFLFGKRSGGGRHYLLTDAGDFLYSTLSEQPESNPYASMTEEKVQRTGDVPGCR